MRWKKLANSIIQIRRGVTQLLQRGPLPPLPHSKPGLRLRYFRVPLITCLLIFRLSSLRCDPNMLV